MYKLKNSYIKSNMLLQLSSGFKKIASHFRYTINKQK